MSKEQTAHIRRIDQLGRISIPKNIREALSLRPDDELRITLSGKSVVMEKAKATCVFCGAEKELVAFEGKCLCSSCREKLISL